MAKRRKTPFGPEVEEDEPAGGAPKPPPVDDGAVEVSASGLITGTGRVTFEKLYGPYPTNEILRDLGYPPRQIRITQVTWDDAYQHFLEAGLPPDGTEAQYELAAGVYTGDAPWATTGLPQFAAVQHVSRKSGRGEVRWISKFPDARTPNADGDPVPYWEGPPAATALANPHMAISTFQLHLLSMGVEIPDGNLHPWIKRNKEQE